MSFWAARALPAHSMLEVWSPLVRRTSKAIRQAAQNSAAPMDVPYSRPREQSVPRRHESPVQIQGTRLLRILLSPARGLRWKAHPHGCGLRDGDGVHASGVRLLLRLRWCLRGQAPTTPAVLPRLRRPPPAPALRVGVLPLPGRVRGDHFRAGLAAGLRAGLRRARCCGELRAAPE